MLALCEIHDRKFSTLLSDLYWKVLEPFTDEQCELVFKELLYSTRFFPKPVEFIEKIMGTQTNRATLAWLDVLEAVKRIGPYQSVKFPDLVIHGVIEAMGGWVQLGGMLTDEEKWKQREFERLYQILETSRGANQEYLPGIVEIDNAARGFHQAVEPVLLGDAQDNKPQLRLVVGRST
jgi:hypothetical protein